jgi:hypothetical protein
MSQWFFEHPWLAFAGFVIVMIVIDNALLRQRRSDTAGKRVGYNGPPPKGLKKPDPSPGPPRKRNS